MAAVPGALAAFTRHPAAAAVFIDFDGTLAPIAADPAAARPLPGARDVLVRLARRMGLVAVVSGRPVAFLTDVLGSVPGVHLIGLYGMETAGADGAAMAVSAEVERWRPVVAEETARASREAPPGAFVEAKGLTVTLHWRAAPAAERWARRFAAVAHSDAGLVAVDGRAALELRPPVAVDKGTVVRRLAPGHRLVACFGDDVGDLPAFAALDELSARGTVAVKVAVVDDEAPPEVAAAADVTVDGPAAAVTLLEALAGPA